MAPAAFHSPLSAPVLLQRLREGTSPTPTVPFQTLPAQIGALARAISESAFALQSLPTSNIYPYPLATCRGEITIAGTGTVVTVWTGLSLSAAMIALGGSFVGIVGLLLGVKEARTGSDALAIAVPILLALLALFMTWSAIAGSRSQQAELLIAVRTMVAV
jgi:hypothetical protein